MDESAPPPRTRVVKKGEPKVFFSAERTLLSWLTHAVYLGSAAAGVLGVYQIRPPTSAGDDPDTAPDAPAARTVARLAKGVALLVLASSLVIIGWSARVFVRRNEALRGGGDGGYDELWGPLLAGGSFLALLVALLASAAVEAYASVEG